jgi:hypothetical protein
MGRGRRRRATLNTLKAGDTLVIYKPDRVARSMKELLVLLEDDLHAKDINLHILTGICAGVHRPNAASIAEKMLFMVASMAKEMERDLIRECTVDGLAAAAAQGRKGGRPPVLNPDTLAIALARRARGESVTAIAAHLKIGRSTLYRALQPGQGQGSAAMVPATPPLADKVTAPALADGLRPVRARIRQPDEPLSLSERELRDRLLGQREAMRASACPTCGNEPAVAPTRWRQRQDLAITWLYPDAASELRVVERCTARRVSRTSGWPPWSVSYAGTDRCWQATWPRRLPTIFRRPWCGPGWSTRAGRSARGCCVLTIPTHSTNLVLPAPGRVTPRRRGPQAPRGHAAAGGPHLARVDKMSTYPAR